MVDDDIVTIRARHLGALSRVVEAAWRIRLGHNGRLPIVVGLSELIEALEALEEFHIGQQEKTGP